MKNKIKRYLKYSILFIIEMIEKIEYKDISIDENDMSKKIIDDIKIYDLKIDTPQGLKPITNIYKTQPYRLYNLKLKNGLTLDCADNHIVFDQFYNQVFVKDLKIGNKIQTKFGISDVISLKKSPFKISMYDVSVQSSEHEFYSNDIISHNTTTISAFFAWYLCFHTDRNLSILANKQATAIEIVSKVTLIFRDLPFFLKPGIDNIGALGMRLDNGCQLFSQATTKTAQIGFTIHVMYMDEFAHIPNGIARDFWRSVYPTLSSSLISQCIITSTPAGMSNLFFEIWDNAVKEKNSFVATRVDYWEVAEHDNAWVQQMKLDFGLEEFAQEFELQFTVNSKLLLAGKELALMKRIERDYVYDDLERCDLDEELYRNLKWHPNFDINRDFNPLTDRFVLSIDTGEGKLDQEVKDNDYNIINIYQIRMKSIAQLRRLRKDQLYLKNMFMLVQVGLFRDNNKDDEVCAKIARSLIFDQIGLEMCTLLIEMNFNGKNFLTHFSNHPKYEDSVILYTHHTTPMPGQTPIPKKPGFKVTSDKEFYCKLGKNLIRDNIIINSEHNTIMEFSSFGKDKNGKYKGLGNHDDAVMSALNVSRLYNDESYEWMLEDFIEDLPSSQNKSFIMLLLEKLEETEETDDGTFDAMYGSNPEEIYKNIEKLMSPTSSHSSMSTSWSK